ncbi:hypothetical protein QJS04_geneDACA003187 [Acorus gramineus]|uniref:Secreted protein n=1 Tax=Acorus gramineus TaxID=55184 RepID=A0AAV9BXJ0_ACOGR|nr:hypothetical protein QJS04_geneDACA003187 [Acorus gramineus]
MSYLSTVWMAASLAVIRGKAEQPGLIGSSGNLFSRRCYRRPLSGGFSGFFDDGGDGPAEERRSSQTDESLRKVMYLSCWSQI